MVEVHSQARRHSGRVAFITGGARGFGAEFAEALAVEGASIVLADVDSPEVERTAAGLRSRGYAATGVVCDVSQTCSVDAAVEAAVAEFGGIDILVNNAGLHLTKYNQAFSSLLPEDVRKLFDVNIFGVINTSLACRESMRARGGGSIVNISSIAGHHPATAYGVSKAAVRALTQSFAHDFSLDEIRCNAISPGLIGTPSALADLPAGVVTDFVDNRQLIHRLGRPRDIVAMLMFLCSEESSFITGETFKVSGGAGLSL